MGHQATQQTKMLPADPISELGPVVRHPESLTLRHPTRGDAQSRWQQQRNKIFRNVRCIRSPSTPKRPSRRGNAFYRLIVSDGGRNHTVLP